MLWQNIFHITHLSCLMIEFGLNSHNLVFAINLMSSKRVIYSANRKLLLIDKV